MSEKVVYLKDRKPMVTMDDFVNALQKQQTERAVEIGTQLGFKNAKDAMSAYLTYREIE